MKKVIQIASVLGAMANFVVAYICLSFVIQNEQIDYAYVIGTARNVVAGLLLLCISILLMVWKYDTKPGIFSKDREL